MSSSSSDSDSDDFEPIRKIKINIRPKDETTKKNGADVNEIKASIEAWRPLGPPVHPSLSRRQSSMSSVSSLSFGMPSTYGGGGGSGSNTSSYTTTTPSFANLQEATTATPSTKYNMRSSPSCSSLVNEFTNRSSFSNFMSNSSRTSSPLSVMNQQHGDTVPIAIAIQESIEVTVMSQRGPDIGETKFNTRALGNIKVAFPNAFAQRCNSSSVPVGPVLKLRIHSTENIIRYYGSKFIKDLNLDTPTSSSTTTTTTSPSNPINSKGTHAFSEESNTTTNSNTDNNNLTEKFSDFFDLNESPIKGSSKFKLIEFDMEALVSHLKQLYLQAPTSRYFNVDVLRYQIAPIQEFEKCPLQVCAYWKCEPKLTKVRIDFKHSNKCGINLERLRDIKFCIDLANLIPNDIHVNSLSPHSISSMKLNNNNNNDSIAMNMNNNGGYTMMTSSDGNNIDSLLNTIKSMNTPSISSNNSISSPSVQPRNQLVSSTGSQHQHLTSQHNTHLVTNQRAQKPESGNLMSGFDEDKNSSFGEQPSRQKPSGQGFQIKLPPPPSRSNILNRTQAATSKQPSLTRQSTLPLAVKLQSTTPMNCLPSHSPPQANTVNDQRRQQQQNHQTQLVNPASQHWATTTSFVETNNKDFNSFASSTSQYATLKSSNPIPPFVTYEPPAHWNHSAKQLTWKFDNLLPYYKTDGLGSLLAKLDFRSDAKSMLANNSKQMENKFAELEHSTVEPKPVDVKFMIVDSTLSKISISIDTIGYRMSLLKKEIRSGRYQSEPYIF